MHNPTSKSLFSAIAGGAVIASSREWHPPCQCSSMTRAGIAITAAIGIASIQGTALAQTNDPELPPLAKMRDANNNNRIERSEAGGPLAPNFDDIDCDKSGSLDGKEILGFFQGGECKKAAGAADSTTPAQAQGKELIFNIFIPKRAPVVARGMIPWARQVEKASGGTINIKIPTATLAPSSRQFDIVQDGVADIAVAIDLSRARQIQLPAITKIPFASPTAAAASSALWSTHKKHFEQVNEYKGFVLLTSYTLESGQIQSSTIPIKGMADLKKIKIRATPGVATRMLKAMGANVVPSPGIKMFELVSGGVVEGNFAPEGPAMILGLSGTIKHFTIFPGGFDRQSLSILMNVDSFSGLPADARRALTSTSGGKLAARLGALADVVTGRARGVFTEKGAKFHDASPKFLAGAKKATAFVEQDWLKKAAKKGVNANAALAFYRSQIKISKPVQLQGSKGK